MRYETYTLTLPERAPQRKILNIVNSYTDSRILGLIDAKGYDGEVTVQLTQPHTSMETIHNLIRHCCQNSQSRI
ncbi:hypothetical protein A2635_05425 [Candidatus Peribacteria bacterium RIFCSPHIGHO2_01_FULL_51_9]|nr:MAG: hypothetical protein A2635_05425 [Candidatus Peribacteria bacterium RIFCSPHIGHO2_01_FULL_51_9]